MTNSLAQEQEGKAGGQGGIGVVEGLVTRARLIIAPLEKAAGVRLHYCPMEEAGD